MISCQQFPFFERIKLHDLKSNLTPVHQLEVLFLLTSNGLTSHFAAAMYNLSFCWQNFRENLREVQVGEDLSEKLEQRNSHNNSDHNNKTLHQPSVKAIQIMNK